MYPLRALYQLLHRWNRRKAALVSSTISKVVGNWASRQSYPKSFWAKSSTQSHHAISLISGMSSPPMTTHASHADAVKAYLAGIPGVAFRAPGDLVQFEAGVTIDAALKVFGESKVTGAPVYIGTPLYDEMTDVVRGCAGMLGYRLLCWG